MKEFIEHYAEVFPLFAQYGFKEPIIHSRKENPNSDKVLIFVTDMYTEENELKPQADRLWKLKNKLKQYISLHEILFLTPPHLGAKTIEALKAPKAPALILTSELEKDKESLEKELIRIFGKQWVISEAPASSDKNDSTAFFGSPKSQSFSVKFNDSDVENLLELMERVMKAHPQEAARIKEKAMRVEADIHANNLVK